MIVGIFLTPSYFGEVFGLSCAAPNVTQSFEESDVVFVGEVVSKEYLEPSNEHSLIAESLFSIKEPFKGIFQDHVKVSSDEKFWGINYTLGLEYLVFADYLGSEIQSQLCGPTNLVEFSNVDFIRNISEINILPPLKQFSSGIMLENVTCKNNYELIFKSTDNSPACVKPETKIKLIQRGWGEPKPIVEPEIDTIKETDYDSEKFYEEFGPGSPLIYLETSKPVLDYENCDRYAYWLTEHQKEKIDLNEDYPRYPPWGNQIFPLVDYCIANGDLLKFETSDKIQWSFYRISNETAPKLDEAPGLPTEINFQDSVNANNQFAIDYYSQVNDDQNIFFSPWSITSAFAILNEGAKGNTADEIQNVFGLNENSKEQFQAINKILNQEKPGYTIEVANSLWLAQDFTLDSDYVDTVQTYYDGTIEKVDFADDGTDVINDWVSDKTRQKIPELFSPPLDPNTRLVIANAIYFNGTWSMPFDEKNTRDDKFILSPGEDITVPFMNKDSFYNFTAADDFQILELSYEGNGASMLILLPERIDGISSVESQLTAENLAKWRTEMTESRLFLQIPKFTLETEYSLGRDLIELGIVDAFIGPADFSGISSEPLLIDRAVHKAFVDVNEKGTEAAAATGVAMATSMPPTFRADHPFVFVILDNETGNILFLGKVVDPSQ